MRYQQDLLIISDKANLRAVDQMSLNSYNGKQEKTCQSNLNVSAPVNRIANNKCCLNPPRDYVVPTSHPPKHAILLTNLSCCPFLMLSQGVNAIEAGGILIYRKNIPEYKISSI